MYETFLEVKHIPFLSQIQTKSLYLSSMLDETLSRLECAPLRQHFAVVTVVDYADLLDKEILEEIRFLLNYRMDSYQPMALILSGQNELWDKLKFKRYAAIRQRIVIMCEIPQMSLS